MRAWSFLLVLAPAVAPVSAEPTDAFERRFRNLAATSTVFRVPAFRGLRVGEQGRQHGLDRAQPTLPEPAELLLVVKEKLSDLDSCYAAQTAERPEWTGRIILDVAIRRSGRVSEIALSPPELATEPLGMCLFRRVARWRFPAFSGETAPRVTQEAITASFPIEFSP